MDTTRSTQIELDFKLNEIAVKLQALSGAPLPPFMPLGRLLSCRENAELLIVKKSNRSHSPKSNIRESGNIQ